MLFHRRRIATTRSPATPIGPKGWAEWPRLRRRSSVTMNEHCSLVAPRIRGRCARNDGKAIYETQH